MPFYQTPAFINFAIFLGLVVGCGLFGHWLAKAWRVAEYGSKFGVILFAMLASSIIIYRGWPPKLGIDLGGGTTLVYKVDETKRVWRPEMMDDLLTSISKRINPGGQKEISVRKLGNDMVEIDMPAVSGANAEQKQAEAEEIRKIIRTTGALEFRIVASLRDNEDLIKRARIERQKYPVDPIRTVRVYDLKRIDPNTNQPLELAKWCRVRDKEVDKVRGDDGAMMVGKHMVKEGDKEVEKEAWEVLVLSPDPNADVTGSDVRDARVSTDSDTGLPEVAFSFTSAGGAKFGRLTGKHLPQPGGFKYHLAIVLDDELITDPVINSVITDNGRITSDNFTVQEVTEIVGYINAGSLPAALEAAPVRDMTIDATLGADTIAQSKRAMYISSIVVPLFMIFYYRFAGIVAVLGLALNMLMLVAVMILIKAPFTLPALAGLALTVGMDVDNNVLIYERLREELAHGAALRMAIRNAFHRVGVVIIDANITHLIAATVLWSVGTEQIKGFAITFWLGAVLSIWATMFVARVMFEVSERRRWLTKMKMMQWIGHTKIDFMAWFPACATFSVLITVLGIVVALVRGGGLFDTDFTGGVSVQAVFQDAQDIEQIRRQVDSLSKELPDATVTPAYTTGEPENRRFIIVTSNSHGDEVAEDLKKLFGDHLVNLELTAKPLAPPKAEIKQPEKQPEKPGVAKAEEKPARSPGEAAAPKKPEETKPAQPKPAEAKPAEAKPAEAKPAEAKPAEAKPAETKPAGAKPAETKPAETKPAETKPAETKPAETKPAETKPTDNKPAAAKPADNKPTETKPAETKPADSKPADSKPADSKPADSKPADNTPKQSQTELPPGSLVAMAGPEAVLLALADAPSPKGTADLKPAAKPEAKADTKTEPKPETKPEAKADAKPEAKADAKTGTKPEAKSELKPAAKPESKPQSIEMPPPPTPKPAAPAASAAVFQANIDFASTVPVLENGQPAKSEKPVRYDEDRLKKLVSAEAEAENLDHVLVDLTAAPDPVSTKSAEWTLKLSSAPRAKNPLTEAKFKTLLGKLESSVRGMPYFPIVDNIGSAVANDTRFWAVVALVSSWSLIILYLWIRFQGVAFGLAAVIALIHDVLVMLGAIAFSSYLALIPGLSTITLIEPFKINLPIVAAFLTIIGYSVNDTIVVFDRIREIRGKSPSLTRQMVNDATNQTLSRTVLTSLTVMMVVVILYIFGGQAVHGFAFALIIGVLTGTYSSIYVAAPILLWLLHPKEMSAGVSADKPIRDRGTR